jgi:hypothetical protein
VPTNRIDPSRAFAATAASAIPALLLVHGLAALLRGILPGPLGGVAMSVATGSLVLVALLTLGRRRGTTTRVLAALLASVAITALHGTVSAAALAVAGIGLALAFGVPRLARSLPQRVDGYLSRHRRAGIAWIALCLLCCVQLGRLGAHMTDPKVDWWITTDNAMWCDHQCMTAYVFGADLARQGVDNLYDAEHYPGLCRDAKPHTTVDHLQSHIEDPFQYPPQFLLLPGMALSLCNDFDRIRTCWFVLQTLGFLAVALALASRR